MVLRICVVLAVASSCVFPQANQITAMQVIDRIKQSVGVPWQESTVDLFKTGDSTATVTGIAVTMMATLDVLQRATIKGANLVITHEPTFYNHLDATAQLENANDPVYKEKQSFIKEHHLIVWRFHDFWHMRKPDGIRAGMIHALGWEMFQDKKNENVFHLPQTTLKGLAETLKRQLGINALRVVGSPDASVSTLGLSLGFAGFDQNRNTFQLPGVDVLIIGEAHEWETIEYAADAVTTNNKKGLIILGHIPSEQSGMQECAHWLKTFIKEVPIEFVPTKEPFWLPE